MMQIQHVVAGPDNETFTLPLPPMLHYTGGRVFAVRYREKFH